MVKRFLISCGIAFAALTAKATPDDSIKVVKGQVSDYYITVTQDRIVKGHVLDTNRQPLTGATVMFFASPMHNTTAHDGSFAIKGAKNDVHLYVYYPGKKIVNRILALDETDIEVVMEEEVHKATAIRRPAQATRWYDPQAPLSRTFCNPMNISYNFEPFNNNVRPNGSFRSSADPMAVCRLSTPFKTVKSCGRAPIGEALHSPLCRRRRIIRPPQPPRWYTPRVSRSLPETSA